MIVSKIYGGLAGQMLQYATGKALAIKNNTDLYLDTEWFKLPIAEFGGTPRHFCLHKFRTHYKSYRYDLLSKLWRKAFVGDIANINEKKFNEFDPEILSLSNNHVLDGYWFSYKYFDSIRDLLIEEFQPRELNSRSQEVLNEIKSDKTAVSIHVRRGDYVTNENANKFHGVMSLDYYKKAIDLVLSKFPCARFYLFSDDASWVRENFKFINDYTIIDFNNDERNHIDIYLMSMCRFNIIANSGFSWWGAYLNQHNDKMVVAPQAWFANEEITLNDLRPESWVLV